MREVVWGDTAQPPIQHIKSEIDPSASALARDLAVVLKELAAAETLLDTDAVCRRYGGCDVRTAREIMRRAGAFKRAGKLWVHQTRLVEEESTDGEVRPSIAPSVGHHQRRRRVTGPEGVAVGADDWYLEA